MLGVSKWPVHPTNPPGPTTPTIKRGSRPQWFSCGFPFSKPMKPNLLISFNVFSDLVRISDQIRRDRIKI